MIKPWNRRLLVELLTKEEEDNSTILVPDNYKPMLDRHVTARVLATSTDGTAELLNSKIAVESNGVEEIIIAGAPHYLVLENYVVCVLED
jgi:co-chaperonin GroES (HSP10)